MMKFTILNNLMILALLCVYVRGISVRIGSETDSKSLGKSAYLSACDETVIYVCGPNTGNGVTHTCVQIYDEAVGGAYPTNDDQDIGIGRVVAARPLCALTNFQNQLIVSSAGGTPDDRLQVDFIDFDTFEYDFFCPSMTHCNLDYAIDTTRTCTTFYGSTETLWDDFFLEIEATTNTAGTYIFGYSGVSQQAFILQAQDQPNPSVVCSCFGGYYFDATDPNAPQCLPCDSSCELCDDNGCTSCADPDYEVYDGVCLPCHPSCATCDDGDCTSCSGANESIFDNKCQEIWYEPIDQTWSIYHHGCVRWNGGIFLPGETGTFTLQSGGTEVLMREDILLSIGGFDWEKIYGIFPSTAARVKADFGTREPFYSPYFDVTIPIMEYDNPCSS